MDDERYNARYKEGWRDPEKRFREYMDSYRDKMEGLSPEAHAETENKIRERYRRYERDAAALEEKEPDFYNGSTQGKHMSLMEFLLHDTNIQIKNAHEAQKSDNEKLRDQIKAKSRQGRDRDDGRDR